MNAATDLPTIMTPLIGRETQTEDILALLATSRLLTLTGPGGIGKTHLALHVAHHVATLFPDGVHYVGLANIPDPRHVIPTISHALGIIETPDQSNLEQLIVAFDQKKVLLILDNFEQVIDAASDILALLTSTMNLVILVTSRIVLRVPGEQEYLVPSLELPPRNRKIAADSMLLIPSIQLFLMRVRSLRPDFPMNEESIGIIANICRHLEGIPLAIELAAARCKVLPPAALLARLNQRLTLLTTSAPTTIDRHQSLRAAISWSYDLLTEQEQRLFRWLSVFVDGFTIEAATALCLGADFAEAELLDSLASLVDKSLLQQRSLTDEPRFAYLETIREYAWEQTVALGEDIALQERHARFFMKLAQQAQSRLRGPEQQTWMDRLTVDHDNLRAALRWAKRHQSYPVLIQITAALWRFWLYQGHLHEGRQWLESALALAPAGDDDSRVSADGEESADLEVLLAQALNGAGNLAREGREDDVAYGFYSRSLAIHRRHNNLKGIAGCLGNLGIIAHDKQDVQAAATLYEESLAISRDLNDSQAIAAVLNNLGILAEQTQAYDRARTLYEESAGYYQSVGNIWGKALSLNNIGIILQRQRDYEAALPFHVQSLTLMHELKDTVGIGSSLSSLAHLYIMTNRPEPGLRILGALAETYETMGKPKSWGIDGLYESCLSSARDTLDPAVFDMAWSEWNDIPLDGIVDLVLNHPADADAREPVAQRLEPKPDSGGLTAREYEVLQLIAQGLTNKEIAHKLSISVYTVGDHISAIFKKMGVSTRSAATRYAFDHGIIHTY